MLVFTVFLSILVTITQPLEIKWTHNNLTVTESDGQIHTTYLKWAKNCDFTTISRTTSNVSESECVRDCLHSEECVGFEWDTSTGTCQQAVSLPFSIIALRGSSCGFKPHETGEICAKHMNGDEKFDWREGHDGVTWTTNCRYHAYTTGLDFENITLLGDCARKCIDNPLCVSFQWRNSTAKCFLNRSVALPHKQERGRDWCGYPTNRLHDLCDYYMREDKGDSSTSSMTSSTTISSSEETVPGGFSIQTTFSSAVVVYILLALVLLLSIIVSYLLCCRSNKKTNQNNAIVEEEMRFMPPPSYGLDMK